MDFDVIMSILIIIGIDIVLGGDNAIVIALASRNLPVSVKNRAIFFGTGLAVIIRIILTILAVFLLKIPFLQFVGGMLLIFIAYNLLTENGEDTSSIKPASTLLSAVRTIVFADVVMGFDNVLAIAGAANGHIVLVMIGLLFSVPIIVGGSKIILIFMEKHPSLVYFGAGILGYTAGNMIVHEPRLSVIFSTYSFLQVVVPIVTIVLVLSAGYLTNIMKPKKIHH